MDYFLDYRSEPTTKRDFLASHLSVEELKKIREVDKKLAKYFSVKSLHPSDYAFAALLGIFAGVADEIFDRNIEFKEDGSFDKDNVKKTLFGGFSPSETFSGKLEKGKVNDLEMALILVKNLGLTLKIPFLPGKVAGDVLSDNGAEKAADSLPQLASELFSDVLIDSFAIKGINASIKKWSSFDRIRGHKIKKKTRPYHLLNMVTFSVYSGVQILAGQPNVILGPGMSAYYFFLLVQEDYRVSNLLRQNNAIVQKAVDKMLSDIENYDESTGRDISDILILRAKNLKNDSTENLDESINNKFKTWED